MCGFYLESFSFIIKTLSIPCTFIYKDIKLFIHPINSYHFSLVVYTVTPRVLGLVVF